MANRGTPYDKHSKGWPEDGDPDYSRAKRDSFAIRDSLDSNEFEPYELELSCPCTWLGEREWRCEDCLSPKHASTDEERILAARKKRRTVEPSGRAGWSRWRADGPDTSLTACGGEPHVWVERERWVPHEGWVSWRTGQVRPPHMVLHRVWRCLTCRCETELGSVRVREGRAARYRRSVDVVREMTPSELERFNNTPEKQRERRHAGWLERMAQRSTGGLSREEQKQAPRKRVERKRDE